MSVSESCYAVNKMGRLALDENLSVIILPFAPAQVTDVILVPRVFYWFSDERYQK